MSVLEEMSDIDLGVELKTTRVLLESYRLELQRRFEAVEWAEDRIRRLEAEANRRALLLG